ncbi:hypothetical protein HBB16_11555 [Pseudonocardia sp. MCCB 268]|nr:hypothetical protein [Pseudonocardia cytotoxica]
MTLLGKQVRASLHGQDRWRSRSGPACWPGRSPPRAPSSPVPAWRRAAGLLAGVDGVVRPAAVGAASGMEVGLLAALLTGTLACYLRTAPAGTPVLAALEGPDPPRGFPRSPRRWSRMLRAAWRAGRLRSWRTLAAGAAAHRVFAGSCCCTGC